MKFWIGLFLLISPVVTLIIAILYDSYRRGFLDKIIAVELILGGAMGIMYCGYKLMMKEMQ